MRDKDGFICLTPRVNDGKYPPQVMPKVKLHRDAVGTYPILEGEEISKPVANSTNTYKFITADTPVHIEYKPKTWQYKAWTILSKGLDFKQKSEFRHIKGGNRKCKHILRIGLALKVRGSGPDTGRPVLDQLTKYNSAFGIYSIADNPTDFKRLLKRWYDMVYRNVESYRKMAIKLNLSEFVYIPKIFIIYDDMSFDCQMGDPRYLYTLLGLKFDTKGNVIL